MHQLFSEFNKATSSISVKRGNLKSSQKLQKRKQKEEAAGCRGADLVISSNRSPQLETAFNGVHGAAVRYWLCDGWFVSYGFGIKLCFGTIDDLGGGDAHRSGTCTYVADDFKQPCYDVPWFVLQWKLAKKTIR
nr:hypothetical protein [Tanacetum cinerariifolium]